MVALFWSIDNLESVESIILAPDPCKLGAVALKPQNNMKKNASAKKTA